MKTCKGLKACRSCKHKYDLKSSGRYCPQCGQDWWDGLCGYPKKLNKKELKMNNIKFAKMKKLTMLLVCVLISITAGAQVYWDEIDKAVSTSGEDRPGMILLTNQEGVFDTMRLVFEVRNDSLCLMDGDCLVNISDPINRVTGINYYENEDIGGNQNFTGFQYTGYINGSTYVAYQPFYSSRSSISATESGFTYLNADHSRLVNNPPLAQAIEINNKLKIDSISPSIYRIKIGRGDGFFTPLIYHDSIDIDIPVSTGIIDEVRWNDNQSEIELYSEGLKIDDVVIPVSNDISVGDFGQNNRIFTITRPTGYNPITSIVNIEDEDSDPTNELQDLSSIRDSLLSVYDRIDNVDDADNDPTNEIQDLTGIRDTTNLLLDTLSNYSTDLIDDVDDDDPDPTNEIQDISIVGQQLTISGGSTITIPQDGFEPDTDDQTLSVSGTTLAISNGNAVTIPQDGNGHWSLSGSNVYKIGANVGIGTSSPSADFEFVGAFEANYPTLGKFNFVADGNWNAMVSGAYNVGFGKQNAESANNSNYNFVSGFRNFKLSTSLAFSFASGLDNFHNAQGTTYSFANGRGNCYNNTGDYVFANGGFNLFNNEGNYIFANGSNNLYVNEGSYNFANGLSNLRLNTTGEYNFASGNSTFYANTTGNHNFGHGELVMQNNNGNVNYAVGKSLGSSATSSNNSILIGENLATNGNFTNSIYIGKGMTSAVSNSLNIGYSSTPLVYGEFNNSLIKINGKLGYKTNGSTATTLQGNDGTYLSDITLGTGLSLTGGTLSATGSSPWNISGSNINYIAGNVSIGTTSGVFDLNIDGSMWINNGVIIDGGNSGGSTDMALTRQGLEMGYRYYNPTIISQSGNTVTLGVATSTTQQNATFTITPETHAGSANMNNVSNIGFSNVTASVASTDFETGGVDVDQTLEEVRITEAGLYSVSVTGEIYTDNPEVNLSLLVFIERNNSVDVELGRNINTFTSADGKTFRVEKILNLSASDDLQLEFKRENGSGNVDLQDLIWQIHKI